MPRTNQGSITCRTRSAPSRGRLGHPTPTRERCTHPSASEQRDRRPAEPPHHRLPGRTIPAPCMGAARHRHRRTTRATSLSPKPWAAPWPPPTNDSPTRQGPAATSTSCERRTSSPLNQHVVPGDRVARNAGSRSLVTRNLLGEVCGRLGTHDASAEHAQPIARRAPGAVRSPLPQRYRDVTIRSPRRRNRRIRRCAYAYDNSHRSRASAS